MKINFEKINHFYTQAYIAARRNDPAGYKAYACFVDESLKSPSSAEIFSNFLKKSIKNNFLNNVIDRANVEGLSLLFKHVKSNITGEINMSSLKSDKLLKKKTNDVYKIMYPNTGKLRKYLIKRNRVVYDTLKPTQQRNFVDNIVSKILLKF